MPTKKLYQADPYLRECQATVVYAENDHVELDQTCFYAEAGGQVGDTGFINEWRVKDTQNEEGDLLIRADVPVITVRTRVVHILESDQAKLQAGDSVRVKLDWERRYHTMRMHSAAHVVHHFLYDVFGSEGTGAIGLLQGCLIEPTNSRFDFFVTHKLDQDKLDLVGRLANAMIRKNLPIDIRADQNEPDLRYWICGDVEMPCGGTHVRNTSEIGPIVIRRRSKGKNTERVYMAFA